VENVFLKLLLTEFMYAFSAVQSWIVTITLQSTYSIGQELPESTPGETSSVDDRYLLVT